MFAIFKREVRSCFHGMIGYVLTAFLLVASTIYFVALNLGYGLPDFGYYTPVSYTHLDVYKRQAPGRPFLHRSRNLI